MSMREVFGSIEAAARHAAAVMTFGGVDPGQYHGSILFTLAAWGHEYIIIDAKFSGNCGGPELMEDMLDFISEKATKEGIVYKWTGKYTKFKNGNCRFSGRIHQWGGL